MPPAATLAAGAMLGPFTIGAPAADGSFRATDTRTGRPAALRVFAARGWSGEERARFRARAEAGARVSNANAAALLGAGADEELGIEWVAAEALAGEPLAALLAQRGTPPAPLALRIVQEAAAGIAAAHDAGVVHGEVHPGTLFLARGEDRRMSVKVLGLGARAGVPVRSAAARYSAPEVLRREEPGPAADVFSLGVVAYELLAGLPPQWGATLAAMARGQAPQIPVPAVAEALAAAVLRALHPDPARRWPDAASFGGALARATAPKEQAPTMIAAPGWTIAAPAALDDEPPVALDDEPPLPAEPDAEAPEPARLAYIPTRAPRFIAPARGPQPGAVGSAVLVVLLTAILAWAATRGPGAETTAPPGVEERAR